MSRNKKRNDIRNILRQDILRKGYATITDIRNFIPCGYETAQEILHTEMKNALKEHKSTARGINSKRLLVYVGLSIKEIHEYASMEREMQKNMAELPCNAERGKDE